VAAGPRVFDVGPTPTPLLDPALSDTEYRHVYCSRTAMLSPEASKLDQPLTSTGESVLASRQLAMQANTLRMRHRRHQQQQSISCRSEMMPYRGPTELGHWA